jgi:16S rRNA (guanine(966)-N(2))-methyltransferase RsmD
MSLKSESFQKLRKIKNKWHLESWEEFEQKENELYKKFFSNKEPTVQATLTISAGKKKHFQLQIPRNTRPLTSRLKVRLFDILSSDINKKRILDLFAGAGTFGFEALSRGASEVTFVDASKRAERVIIDNANHTGFLTETNIIRQKADEYLMQAIDREDDFDIIFVDPPYKIFNRKDMSRIKLIMDNVVFLLPGIKNPATRKFKGVLLVKHPRRFDIVKVAPPAVKFVETYEFGLNCVSLFIVDIKSVKTVAKAAKKQEQLIEREQLDQKQEQLIEKEQLDQKQEEVLNEQKDRSE